MVRTKNVSKGPAPKRGPFHRWETSRTQESFDEEIGTSGKLEVYQEDEDYIEEQLGVHHDETLAPTLGYQEFLDHGLKFKFSMIHVLLIHEYIDKTIMKGAYSLTCLATLDSFGCMEEMERLIS